MNDMTSEALEKKMKTLEEEIEAKKSHARALRSANEILESQIKRLTSELETEKEHLQNEKKATARLSARNKECEYRYRLHFENVSDVIYLIDSKFCIQNISPSVEAEWGYLPGDLIGKPFTELGILSPKSLEAASSHAMRLFTGDHVDPTVYEFITREGSVKFGEVRNSAVVENDRIVGIISVVRNITERLRTDEERLEKLKLQGVIEMARTVSYELNQPIQAIFSHAELMMMDLEKSHPAYKKAKTISDQVYSLARLIKQLSKTTKYKTREFSNGNHLIDIEKASSQKKLRH